MTRIAVSVENNNGMDSLVAQHFGRCPFFALVDLKDRDIQSIGVIENPYFNNHQPGQVPNFVKQQNANIMLSGGMGRRAVGFFQELGIEAVTGVGGTVRQAVEQYLQGGLSGAAPCKESEEHFKRGFHQ